MNSFEKLITLVEVSDGPQGPAGPSGELYRLEANVEKISQFKNSNGTDYEFSIEFLIFSFYENNIEKDMELANFEIAYSYKDKENTVVSLPNSSEILNKEDKKIKLDFLGLLQLLRDSSYDNLDDLYTKVPVVFTFSYDGTVKRIVYDNGLSNEMLDFSITASTIQSAIANKKMKFSTNGLELSGTGFTIYNNLEDKTGVLYADNQGNLVLKNIKSESGTIGGFAIKEDQLVGGNNLILNGRTGSLIVKDITLGDQAKIGDRLTFSRENSNAEGRILNPTNYDGKFIVGGRWEDGNFKENLIIGINGRVGFGNIFAESEQSTLWAKFPGTEEACWKLTPTHAYFNNIVASGSIETSIFRKGHTQAVGGAMIFKPSYKILNKTLNGDYIQTIEIEAQDFEANSEDKVWLIPKTGQYGVATVHTAIQSEDRYIITFKEENILDGEYLHIIYIGAPKNNYIFAINSGNTPIGEGNIIKPLGLTMTTYEERTYPNLFLGDLRAVNQQGYGLYCDNVYLNGSLTTKAESGSYAGINTLNGIKATIFDTEDNSNIIFWAGANSTSASDIQQSYFQVTENGSVYASRAKLTSTLFVGGEIRGTDIYTARIHGTGNENGAPALSIYDTKNGISFFDAETETCKITQNGFYSSKDNVSITFKVSESNSKIDEVKLDKFGLYYEEYDKQDKYYKKGLLLDENKISIVFLNEAKIEIDDFSSTFYNEIKIKQNFLFGEKGYFTQVEGGVDLYIKEVGN